MTCVDGMYFKVNKDDMTAMMMATYDMAVNIPGINQSYLSGEAQNFGPDANVPSKITLDGEEYTVTNLQAGAFYDTPNVTSATLNEGLLNVEYETFYGTKVEEVVFPNSMESLEDTNFYYCPNVKSVTFGTDMKTIGANGFVGCPNLTSALPQYPRQRLKAPPATYSPLISRQMPHSQCLSELRKTIRPLPYGPASRSMSSCPRVPA